MVPKLQLGVMRRGELGERGDIHIIINWCLQYSKGLLRSKDH